MEKKNFFFLQILLILVSVHQDAWCVKTHICSVHDWPWCVIWTSGCKGTIYLAGTWIGVQQVWIRIDFSLSVPLPVIPVPILWILITSPIYRTRSYKPWKAGVAWWFQCWQTPTLVSRVLPKPCTLVFGLLMILYLYSRYRHVVGKCQKCTLRRWSLRTRLVKFLTCNIIDKIYIRCYSSLMQVTTRPAPRQGGKLVNDK